MANEIQGKQKMQTQVDKAQKAPSKVEDYFTKTLGIPKIKEVTPEQAQMESKKNPKEYEKGLKEVTDPAKLKRQVDIASGEKELTTPSDKPLREVEPPHYQKLRDIKDFQAGALPNISTQEAFDMILKGRGETLFDVDTALREKVIDTIRKDMGLTKQEWNDQVGENAPHYLKPEIED